MLSSFIVFWGVKKVKKILVDVFLDDKIISVFFHSTVREDQVSHNYGVQL